MSERTVQLTGFDRPLPVGRIGSVDGPTVALDHDVDDLEVFYYVISDARRGLVAVRA